MMDGGAFYLKESASSCGKYVGSFNVAPMVCRFEVECIRTGFDSSMKHCTFMFALVVAFGILFAPVLVSCNKTCTFIGED